MYKIKPEYKNKAYIKKRIQSLEKNYCKDILKNPLANITISNLNINSKKEKKLQMKTKSEKESLRKESIDTYKRISQEKRKNKKPRNFFNKSKRIIINDNFNNIINDSSFFFKNHLDEKSKRHKNKTYLSPLKNENKKLENRLNITEQEILNISNKKKKEKNYEENKSFIYEINSENDYLVENDNINNKIFEIENKTFLKGNLTPIPKRIGPKQNPIAEYDYNQAKSAAILVRRLEYSYNLRLTKIFENHINEIIFIQRKFREFLKKKNQGFIQKLVNNEIQRIQNEQRLIQFIERINFAIKRNKMKKFFRVLINDYAFLIKKHFLDKFVNKIIVNYRKFTYRKNQKKIKKFSNKLRFISQQVIKKNLINFFRNFIEKINLIKKLQNSIKFFLLKNNEKYKLKFSYQYHPYLFFRLKYMNNPSKIENKINKFKNFILKWKNYTKEKKEKRLIEFINRMNHILLYQFFNSFIMKFARKTNAFLIYFLLKPLFNDILFIYYKNMINKGLLGLRANSKKLKRNDILSLNLIKKCIKSICFNPFIRKFKIRKFLNVFIRKLIIVIYRHLRFQNRKILFSLRQYSNNIKILNENQRRNILKYFFLRKNTINISIPFIIWKNIYLIEKNNKISKELLIKCKLKSILKNNKIKYKQRLIHFFYYWIIQMYKLINYEKKVYFFISRIIEVLKINVYSYIYECLKNIIINIKKNQNLKNIFYKNQTNKKKLLNFYFLKMKSILKKEKIINFSIKLNKYYKKKIVLKKKDNRQNTLKKIILKKEQNIKSKLLLYFHIWRKNTIYQKLLSSTELIQRVYRKYKKRKQNNNKKN